MHAKRISWIFLFALLIAAPASAQWFIHYQTPENDVWRKSPHAWTDEALALQNARNNCRMNSNIRTAKIVGPGKETVYQCSMLVASQADSPSSASTVPPAARGALPTIVADALSQSAATPAKSNAIEAMRRIVAATQPAPAPDTTALSQSTPTPARGSAIEAMRKITGASQPAPAPDPGPSHSTQALALQHCEQDSQLSMLADCQCARTTFAARPSSFGNKSGSRLAVEACPAQQAHIASEYHRQCVKDGFNLLPEDVDPVCRCMATDFAAKYVANPVFDVPHLSQLRETAFRTCMVRR